MDTTAFVFSSFLFKASSYIFVLLLKILYFPRSVQYFGVSVEVLDVFKSLYLTPLV